MEQTIINVTHRFLTNECPLTFAVVRYVPQTAWLFVGGGGVPCMILKTHTGFLRAFLKPRFLKTRFGMTSKLVRYPPLGT